MLMKRKQFAKPKRPKIWMQRRNLKKFRSKISFIKNSLNKKRISKFGQLKKCALK